MGGPGGILYLNEDTRFEIKFALRQGINNKAELVALWAILKLAQEKQVKNLQLFGDSKLTTDWANGNIQINSPHLQHQLRALRE